MENRKSLGAVLSNLSKAAEKQQLGEISAIYGELAARFNPGVETEGSLATLKELMSNDLENGYPRANLAGDNAGDRGALRAVKWGEKVTKLQKTLINRYESKGDALFEDNNLYICEACGFLYLGSDTPEACPVCKAPSSRFSMVR